MRLQTLRRFFREPAAGFESGDYSRPHAAGSSSRDDLVSAKPSTGQALSKLDAALGLAHRVRSKSATPRVSPYSQPVKKAIIARDKKKPVVPVAPRKKWVTESPASGPDQPPAAAAGKSPVAGAPVPSEGEAIASVPLPLLVARAVLIDMEPKVIHACFDAAERSGQWCFDKGQAFCQQSGSGNNWAHGYYVHGPHCAEEIMRRIRAEVARAPDFGGFVLLQSVAGGTGSGLGSFVTEVLRREYPDASLLNCVVWPFKAGEVCVQNYNCILTMSKLCQSSDGILLLENEMASAVCKQLMNIASPGFDDLNAVLAKAICALLLPAVDSESKRVVSLSRLLAHLCNHPGYRILTARMLPMMSVLSVPFSVHTWAGVLKHLKQMQMTGSMLEEGVNWRVSERSPALNRAVKSLVVLRGRDSAGAFPEACAALGVESLLRVCTEGSRFGGYEKAAACFSSCRSTAELLNHSLSLAAEMFAVGAFTHQFETYGLTKWDMRAAFAAMEQVLHNYSRL